MMKHTVVIVHASREGRYSVLEGLIERAKLACRLELVFEGRLFSIAQAESFLATLAPVDAVA